MAPTTITEDMIRNNETEIIEKILQEIDDENEDKKKILDQMYSGQTALHIAAAEGFVELVCILLQQGAEINAIDKNHWTPLHCAAQKFHLEICEILLQHGANVHLLTVAGTSAFHYLVRGDYKDNKNLFNRVAELILTNGQDINLENKSGETPLHGACLEGRHLCIRWLVEHNVNVHVTNKYGDTPLHYAARKGAEDAVTILLEAGADPFVSGSYGTPKSVAKEYNQFRIMKIIDNFISHQQNNDQSSDEEEDIDLPSMKLGTPRRRTNQLRNGPINTPPTQRKLRHIRSIAIRNLQALDRSNPKLRDVYFTLHRIIPSNDNSSPSDLSDHLIYKSHIVKNTANPSWDFTHNVKEVSDEIRNTTNRFSFKLWDVSPDRHDPICLIDLTIRLYRLSYVGKLQDVTYPSVVIFFELLDGYYVKDDVASILAETGTLRIDSSRAVGGSKKTYNFQTLEKILMSFKQLESVKEENQRLQNELHHRLPSHIEYFAKKRKKELLLARIKKLTQERDRQLELLNKERKELEVLKEEILPKTQLIAKALVPLLASKQMFQECLKELKFEKEAVATAEDALEMRQSTLIRQLRLIFPITQSQNKLCINGIKLPNSDNFAGNDEEQIATALGFVCQILCILSKWLEVPLRYPMTPVSSRSTIRDEISHPTANAKFPLYSKGVERTRFDYGVYLLEKNLEQMLNSQGLSIITLRHILPNLQLFLVSKGKSFGGGNNNNAKK